MGDITELIGSKLDANVENFGDKKPVKLGDKNNLVYIGLVKLAGNNPF